MSEDIRSRPASDEYRRRGPRNGIDKLKPSPRCPNCRRVLTYFADASEYRCRRCVPVKAEIDAPSIREHSGKALYSVTHGGHEEPPPGCMDTRDIARRRGVL